MRVAWDISHLEFTVEDHYYFSKLKKLLEQQKIHVSVLENFGEIEHFDVLVLNYPEEPFNSSEIDILVDFVKKGGRIVALGYYNNEDNVAEILNGISAKFGMKLLDDVIVDEKNNVYDDPCFPITSRVSNLLEKVEKVVLPCSAPIKIEDNRVVILVQGEKSARSIKGNSTVFAALSRVGGGEFILVGTCVFWDNYSIDLFDNKKLALWLLRR